MSRTPVIGVLAIQGDVREHERSLRASGADPVRIRDVAQLDSIDALVIPGGESTTMSKLAIADGMLDPMRAKRAAGMPMYGSCAGMIMLADRVLDARPDQQTVGGLDITVRRNAFGRQVDSFEADIPIHGIEGGDVRAVFIRAPWVESVGDGVEVLATVADDVGAGTIVAVREGPLLATSFHPELTPDTRVHRLFVEIVRQHA